MKRLGTLIQRSDALAEQERYQTGHHCPTCGAFMPDRYLPFISNRPDAQPTRYVTLCACEKADQEAQARRVEQANRLLAQAGLDSARRARLEESCLDERNRAQTFDTFKADRQPDAYDAAIGFIDARGWRVLVLSGEPRPGWDGYGSGKTHLASALVNAALARDESAALLVVPDFLRRVRASYADDAEETEDRLLRAYGDMPMLALDDWGREPRARGRDGGDPWSVGLLYSLVNARYSKRLPLVVTTNLGMDRFTAWVGGAVASRILEAVEWVDMRPGDYRLEMGGQRR